MARFQIFSHLDAITVSINTTNYRAVFNGATNLTSTENNYKVRWRTAGTASGLMVYSTAHGANTMTVALRVNGVDSALSISAASGVSGHFEDLDTVAIAAGDDLSIKHAASTGSGGAYVVSAEIHFEPTDTSLSMYKHGVLYGSTFSTASATRYYMIGGNTAVLQTTENLTHIRMKTAGDFKNMAVVISSNSRGTATIYKFRKNDADSGPTVSVTASTTGTFEDTSNTSTVASGDDVNFAMVTGTGTGSIGMANTSIEFVSTNNTVQTVTARASGVNITVDSWIGFGGNIDADFASASDTTSYVDQDFIVKNAVVDVTTNSIASQSTAAIGINGSDSAVSVAITASTTGLFEDTTHTANVVVDDYIGWHVTRGGAGTLTLRSLSAVMEVQGDLAIDVNDARSITESVTAQNTQLGAVSVSDARSITESVTVSVSAASRNLSVFDAVTITENEGEGDTDFVNDTMTDTDSTSLGSHTGEVGATWAQHGAYAGAVSIVSNRSRITTGPSAWYASGQATGDDYSVHADLYIATTNNGDMGVLGRLSNTSLNTFYLFRYSASGTIWQLYSFVNGTATLIDSAAATVSNGVTYHIELRMTGDLIQAFVDDVEVCNVTDTAVTTGTRVGFRGFTASSSTTTGVHIDRFWATETGSSGIPITFAHTPIVNDARSITESVTVSVSAASGGTYSISVTDSPSITESVTRQSTLNISVFDARSITESVSRELNSNISVFDARTITESVASEFVLSISVVTQVAVRDNDRSGLWFDGINDYVNLTDQNDFSITETGELTISVWMRPDALQFLKEEATGYVHWLGKGISSNHEWVFRMYSLENDESRPNRISFYIFNLAGGLGVGSYFQDTITPGEWMHIVGALDDTNTYIYKNGVLRDQDEYPSYPVVPGNGTAPVRIGTRDQGSFFRGALDDVRIYNRKLTDQEVADIYAGNASTSGLVAHWKLDDGTGTNVDDSTANGYDGTFAGGTQAPQWTTPSLSVEATQLGGVSVNDQVAITEAVTAQNTQLGGVSVSDTLSITESITRQSTLHVSVSDLLTITESHAVQNTTGYASVNDQIAIAESVTRQVTLNVSVSDALSISESITRSATLGSISIVQTISIAEGLTVVEIGSELPPSAGEDIDVVEVITITVSDPSPSVIDTLTVSEAVSIILISELSLSDSVGIADVSTLQGTSFIGVNDLVSIAESNSLETTLFANTFDAVSITESLTRQLEGNISVSETIASDEWTQFLIPSLNPSVYDLISIEENDVVLKTGRATLYRKPRRRVYRSMYRR